MGITDKGNRTGREVAEMEHRDLGRGRVTDQAGDKGQGPGRQRQRGTVEKHGALVVAKLSRSIAPLTRGFFRSGGGAPPVIILWQMGRTRRDQDVGSGTGAVARWL